MVELILFRRPDGKWSWQLIVNGDVVATDGGQGSASQDEARAMASKVLGGQYKDAVPRSAER